ncbi:MAG: ATP-binding protein [Bacteroidetes bacterium]|nr:ATP-binding protein [Bacteroidota bacterium]
MFKIKKSNVFNVIGLNIKFADISKKYQLILLTSTLILVVAISLSIWIPKVVEDVLIGDFKDIHNKIVNMTADKIAFHLSESDLVEDKTIFESATKYVMEIPITTHIFIYNNKKNSIFKKVKYDFPPHIQLYRPGYSTDNEIDSTLRLYIVNTEVVYKDVVCGYISCVFSMEELDKTITNTQYWVVMICMLILLFGILTTVFISNLISKPLNVLLATFRRIAGGDLSIRATINTNEEFGQLARTFNKMVNNLEDSYFELSDTNRNMELKVEQRTQQLRNQIEVRTMAEEKLKTTNKMINYIINASPLPILTLSTEFKLKTASPSFTKIFKYEEYEVIDRVLPFVVKSDLDIVKESFISLNAPNKVERIIAMGRRKDGIPIDLNITAVAEFDDNNKKFGYIAIIDDITETLLAEKALKESETKYRSLIEDSIVGIGLIKDNFFVFANTALLEIWKCKTLGEFITVPFTELVESSFRNYVLEIQNFQTDDQNKQNNKDSNEQEIKIMCFDGTEKYVHMASNVLYLDTDVMIQITFVDVTDRKIAENEMVRLNEELEERVIDRTSKLNKTLVDLRNEMAQRARLTKELQVKSEILERTTSFCVVFNKKGGIDYLTPYTENLVGFAKDELIGDKHWEKLKGKINGSEELNIQTIENWFSDTNTLGVSYILEIDYKNEFTKYFRLSNSLGQLNTLIVAGAEITEQMKTQKTLVEMGEKLEKTLENEKELNELKTRFISMVSHEFRTPLTVILNSAGVIEQAFESNRADIGMQYLDKINKSVLTMNQLMEDVLLIGKGQTHKVKIVNDMDFVLFVENSIKDIREAYHYESGVVMNIKDECKPFYSDEPTIKHIVHNLITNALKYTTNGKDVTITIEKNNDNELIFTVADQGIGIPEQDLKLLFSNFFRASNVGKISGTGLGLHIVKQSVDNLLGKIYVDSVVNVGTTFKVILPMDIRQQLREMFG